MEVLEGGLPTWWGRNIGGVAALLVKQNAGKMCREDPYLCSPFLLQISKGADPSRCLRIVQEWPSNHWARHRFPETDHRHPHPRGIPARRQHWVGKWVRMALNLTSLNVRWLRDPSRCSRLLGELSNLECKLLQCRRLTSFERQTVGCWSVTLSSSQHSAAAAALGPLF